MCRLAISQQACTAKSLLKTLCLQLANTDCKRYKGIHTHILRYSKQYELLGLPWRGVMDYKQDSVSRADSACLGCQNDTANMILSCVGSLCIKALRVEFLKFKSAACCAPASQARSIAYPAVVCNRLPIDSTDP